MGSVIFRKPPLKKFAKEGLFGVDMHFHTQYSLDAVSRIGVAIKKAQKKGFGFAITDHNTVDGVMASYRLRKHALIIPGVEVTCSNGNHVLAYFYDHPETEEFFNKVIKPKMRKNPFFADITVSELMEKAKAYNCLIGAPHPFAPGAVGMKHTGITKKIERGLNIIEVINGYNFRKSNMDAVIWASTMMKGQTGGSDAHSTFELGKTLTFTSGHDVETVFEEILKRRSIVVGKEDNIFIKAVMGVSKEGTYVNRSHRQHSARQLLKSQLGTEYRYLSAKFKNGRARHLLNEHHARYLNRINK
ncbi:PHP domain-containing protein [Candidatus Woesearchaeota archaeon]|nr:PHP domain-containing protein [Candidatus Woesearchaeota archaeon]